MRESELIIKTWNDTDVEQGNYLCVHQVIEDQAKRSPQAVALALSDDRVTYGELNAVADRVADVLMARGIRPGQLVGILAERSPGNGCKHTRRP